MPRKQAAAYLCACGYPITAKTLANKAANANAGKGPPFTQLDWRTVRYDRVDLDTWKAGRSRRVE